VRSCKVHRGVDLQDPWERSRQGNPAIIHTSSQLRTHPPKLDIQHGFPFPYIASSVVVQPVLRCCSTAANCIKASCLRCKYLPASIPSRPMLNHVSKNVFLPHSAPKPAVQQIKPASARMKNSSTMSRHVCLSVARSLKRWVRTSARLFNEEQ
jgi:hypothetical protein